MSLRRIGVDLGGVVIGGIGSGDDTMFGEDFLRTPEVPDALPALELLHERGCELHVISKCGPKVEQRSRAWLRDRGFADRTGTPEERWHFVRDRAEKAPLAKRLGLEAFVDDRVDVVRAMVPVVRTAVLLRPQPPAQPLPEGIRRAASWAEALELLG